MPRNKTGLFMGSTDVPINRTVGDIQGVLVKAGARWLLLLCVLVIGIVLSGKPVRYSVPFPTEFGTASIAQFVPIFNPSNNPHGPVAARDGDLIGSSGLRRNEIEVHRLAACQFDVHNCWSGILKGRNHWQALHCAQMNESISMPACDRSRDCSGISEVKTDRIKEQIQFFGRDLKFRTEQRQIVNDNFWRLSEHDGFQCGLVSFFCFLKRAPHVSSLRVHSLALAMGEPTDEYGRDGRYGSGNPGSPIGRRFLLTLLFALSFIFASECEVLIDNNWRWIWPIWLYGSFGGLCGGLLLILLSGFSWSWGWWL